MNEKQQDSENKLSKKEKAESAGKDIAEIGAKALGTYYGGEAGGAIVDEALNTKAGQKAATKAGKRLAKNPIAKRALVKAEPTISQNKENINRALGMSLASSTSSSSSATNSTVTTSDGNAEENSSSNLMTSNNLSSNDNTDTKEKNNKISGSVKGIFKNKSIKFKLITIGIIAGLVFTMIFIVVLISPLMSLGIIDIGGASYGNGSLSYADYSSIGSSTSYWWPIGGSNISIVDGKEFATDSPTCTTITSNFGLRQLDGSNNDHTGIDIACQHPSNQDIVIAALDGTVINVVNGYADGRNKSAGYGNYVKIQHNNGDITIYGHMYINSITVSIGDHVSQGQVIGKMGSSGNSTGTHLHFEIRENGTAIDPANLISSSNPRPTSSTGNYINANSNKESICLSLKANGFTENATIALLTNINHESGFKTDAVGDGGTSYGICQWHNSRNMNLRNAFPNNYDTLEAQIQFLIYELENSYNNLYNNLTTSSLSANELTYKFCKIFESPADTENTCRKRASNSVNFTDYVKNGCK